METKTSIIQKSNEKTGGYARFTRKEKEVLYALFSEYEQVIDIRCRKTAGGSIKVRECWQKILNLYNSHPTIKTQRNLKQIRKFWLNSRLRKQFPPNNNNNNNDNQQEQQKLHQHHQLQPQQMSNNSENIRCEPELLISVESIEGEAFENTRHNDAADYGEQHIQATNANLEHQQSMVNNEIQVQDFSNCIEGISTEKLSLNDLLHFKTTPSQIKIKNSNGIILQTKTSTFPQETVHLTNSNPKMEQYTQTLPTIENYSASTDYPRPSTQQSLHRTKNLINRQKTMQITKETLDDRLNYFKLKEAELKYQKEQIHLEKLKIDLEKSKEELKYMKEVQKLHIEELKTKLSLLQENKIQNQPNKFKVNK